MSDYVQSTNFATKDNLPSGDPLKIVKGTEINTEFANIAIAVATKADLASPTFTGTVTGTFSGNLTGNVTGNISGSAGTASSASSVATTNWTITESGGKLLFKYGGTTVASLNTNGAFVSANDVTAFGTP